MQRLRGWDGGLRGNSSPASGGCRHGLGRGCWQGPGLPRRILHGGGTLVLYKCWCGSHELCSPRGSLHLLAAVDGRRHGGNQISTSVLASALVLMHTKEGIKRKLHCWMSKYIALRLAKERLRFSGSLENDAAAMHDLPLQLHAPPW